METPTKKGYREDDLVKTFMGARDMNQITLVDGSVYTVMQMFGENRCIASPTAGIYEMVDRNPADGTWDLSPNPATGAEMVALKALVDGTPDTVVVTKD